MSIDIYASNHTTKKATITAALSSNLHQSLNGECTFELTMPGKRLPGIALGDEVRIGDLYFDVTQIGRSSQIAGALFTLGCEHISYALSDMRLPEMTISGSPSSGLSTILSGTGLSVGSVTVSGSYSLYVRENTSRRDALQQWAVVCGGEISYYQRSINLLAHVGSTSPVSLSNTENVKSISVTMDGRNNTQSYSVELSRLQALNVGDALSIVYTTLELNVSTRVLSLDYDIFHPMAIRMVCGAYIPTYYQAVQETIEEEVEEATEEILEEVDRRIAGLALDAIYADTGDIAELTVDELRTSRRVQKYILSDTSDDNYIHIKGQYNRLITASVSSTTPVQATNRHGQGLYWGAQPVSHTVDGYPLDGDGNRIYASTEVTSWPVYIYQYTELTKASLAFEQESGTYVPMLIMGAGDNNGRTKGILHKAADGFDISFTDSQGENQGIKMNSAGYMDLYGLRKPTELDFSNWDSGYFSEELDGQQTASWQVDFDAQGRPILITDGDGHETAVVW